jgi:hypothetical protein
MGIKNVRNTISSKKLYNEVLILTAEICEKDIPASLPDTISVGPAGKHPAFICTFLMVLVELTNRPLVTIVQIYIGEKHPDASRIDRNWKSYYSHNPRLESDVAIICMHVREKLCNKR